MTDDALAPRIDTANTPDSRPAQERRVFWSIQEDRRLEAVLDKTLTDAEAAALIPGRTARAVRSRLSRMRADRAAETVVVTYSSTDEFQQRKRLARQSNIAFLAALAKAGFRAA